MTHAEKGSEEVQKENSRIQGSEEAMEEFFFHRK